MRETFTPTDIHRNLLMCPCGAEHHAYRECEHPGCKTYTHRTKVHGEESIVTGVYGPEDNCIPLRMRIYKKDGVQHCWFTADGRAHDGEFEPYREVAEYSAEDFD